MTKKQQEAIEALADRRSAPRQRAAGVLRREPSPGDAGPVLYEAFVDEVVNLEPNVYKALEEITRALAVNPYPPAVDVLLEHAGDDFSGASVVNHGVGLAAVGCGYEDPGTDLVVRALLGDETEVAPDRLSAVIGGVDALTFGRPELSAEVVDRLLTLAEEDPPHTVPRGQHRRRQVFWLQRALLEIAEHLEPTDRDRLLAAADRTVAEGSEYDPNRDGDFTRELARAHALEDGG